MLPTTKWLGAPAERLQFTIQPRAFTHGFGVSEVELEGCPLFIFAETIFQQSLTLLPEYSFAFGVGHGIIRDQLCQRDAADVP